MLQSQNFLIYLIHVNTSSENETSVASIHQWHQFTQNLISNILFQVFTKSEVKKIRALVFVTETVRKA